MEKRTLKVAGMDCKSCVMLVTDALQEAGATNVAVKLNKTGLSEVSFESDAPTAKLAAAIEKEGYKVK